jgi:CheY-like chemotaxis protein
MCLYYNFITVNRIKALKGSCGVQPRTDGTTGSLFWFQIPYEEKDSQLNEYGVNDSLSSDTVLQVQLPLLREDCLHMTEDMYKSSDDTQILMTSTIKRSSSSMSFSAYRAIAPEPNLRVLVVEDSLVILKMVVKLLLSAGYQVDSAENGAIALALIDEVGRSIPYDVVLTDLQMPIMDGFELMSILNSRDRKPLLLAMTANANESAFNHATKSGAHYVFAKPFRIEKFERCVQEYLSSDRTKIGSSSGGSFPKQFST